MDSTSTANLSHVFPEVKGHDVDMQIYSGFPNKWSRYREYFKEPFAEFLGICIFIVFGIGVNCQVVLSGSSNVASTQKGDWLSINFGWAVGVAMAAWIAAGVSGCHINPAVTLTLAVFRGFPWRKVPLFIISQFLGAFFGAGIVYVNYAHAIDAFEGTGIRTLKTAGLFSSYALDYVPNASAFFDEFLGTAILIITLLAILDKRNMAAANGLVPVALFILVLGIGASFGMQTGFALNPARDLGPRVLTALVGYGKLVFNYRNYYWIWCPLLAPILGGFTGAAIYDGLIYTGGDSIFNKGYSNADMTSPV